MGAARQVASSTLFSMVRCRKVSFYDFKCASVPSFRLISHVLSIDHGTFYLAAIVYCDYSWQTFIMSSLICILGGAKAIACMFHVLWSVQRFLVQPHQPPLMPPLETTKARLVVPEPVSIVWRCLLYLTRVIPAIDARVCVCVCVCACCCACMHISNYQCMRGCIYACPCSRVRIHLCMHLRMHICICMCACACACLFLYVYIYIYVCVCVSVGVSVHARVHPYAYVHVCVQWFVRVCIYIYIHVTMHVCVQKHAHTPIHIYKHAHIYIYIDILTHTHIYIYIYI